MFPPPLPQGYIFQIHSHIRVSYMIATKVDPLVCQSLDFSPMDPLGRLSILVRISGVRSLCPGHQLGTWPVAHTQETCTLHEGVQISPLVWSSHGGTPLRFSQGPPELGVWMAVTDLQGKSLAVWTRTVLGG